MTIQLLADQLGLYRPSFLYMELNVDYDFNVPANNHDPLKFGVLLHEYVHFLQDITTTYGLANFSHITNRIRAFAYEAQTRPGNTIYTPIRLQDHENADVNNDLFSLYQGDHKNYYAEKNSGIAVTVEPNGLIEGYEDANEVILHFHDMQGRKVKYSFGAMSIMESMASFIERHVYPQERAYYFLPYDACEMLIRAVYPAFLQNKGNVVALCDASLMHYHPGEVFLQSLYLMKKESYTPGGVNDVYEFVYRSVHPAFEHAFADCVRSSLENIDELFGSASIHGGLNRWGTDLIHRACGKRRQDRGFISHIMTLDSAQAIRYAAAWMEEFGIPLIRDKSGHMYNGVQETYRDADLSVFVALFSFFNVMSDYPARCSLTDICAKLPEAGLVDARCYSAPWNKCNDDVLCPFAQLWKRWGLEGKEVRSSRHS